MKSTFHFDIPESNLKLSKVKAVITALVLVTVLAFVVDYITLPAYNLHDMGTLFLFAVYLGIFAFIYMVLAQSLKLFFKVPAFLAAAIIVFSFGAQVLSSEIINAGRYRDQIAITEQDEFNSDFSLITLDQVPLVDKITAQQLGDKQIGKVQGLGSQFDINVEYTLVTSNNQIFRVSPLEYQDFYKWIQNSATGIPGYVRVNVTDPNDVRLIELDQGIIYSPSAYFNQDLMRHVRFGFRTDIFGSFSFEIDDNGHPFYVVSVIEPEIGWFGGWDTQAVIVVDAVSGEMAKYEIEDLPVWVDRVQPTDLAWSQIDNWGYYVNGWFNTVIGQKDMLQTTDGYNYVSINGQTHIFSGMTSVGADRSIVGFALINLRTKEASFIKVGGADEYSAMSSAQGQVQDLNYEATFPVLLNIESKATYFMSLKDNEGLVKLFAMVNVQDYSVVGVGATVQATKQAYIAQMLENGIIEAAVIENTSVEGTVKTIKEVILQGTTNYFIILNEHPQLFTASADLSVELALTSVGDMVKMQVTEPGLTTQSIVGFDNLNYTY